MHSSSKNSDPGIDLPPDMEQRYFSTVFRQQPENWRKSVMHLCDLHQLPFEPFLPFSEGANLVASVGNKFVVKVFPLFHRHQYESEWPVFNILECILQIATPKLIANGLLQNGWAYIIITQLPGILLEDCWQDFSYAEKLACMYSIGQVMAAVHTIPSQEIFKNKPSWQSYLATQLTTYKARHTRLGMPDWFLSEVEDYISENVDALPAAPPQVLLTGEYTPFNLLVQGERGNRRLTGMIDFGDAMAGFREYDFLGPSLFLAAGDVSLLDSMFSGYGYLASQRDEKLRKRLMCLQILHRYSDFVSQFRQSGWRQFAADIKGLAEIIWPDTETTG